MKKERLRPTSIGGQAVIEGVMMRNDFRYATAVRTNKENIELDKREYTSVTKRSKLAGLPLIRGGLIFIESLVMGVKILGYSAEFFETKEAEPSKFDKWLEEKLGDNFAKVAVGLSVILSLFLSIGLFFFLPALISQYISPLISESTRVMNLIDGIIRLMILLIYMYGISFIKDIQRVFEYHGAEHKTINCYESGAELTVENVKRASRFHKRCGTNFVFIVVAVSIIVLVLINVDTFALRIGVRLITLPLIAGISFEILKFFGRYDNAAIDIFAFPGMMLQRITTNEPDEKQIEVAILAFNTVYNEDKWEVTEKESPEKAVSNTATKELEKELEKEAKKSEASEKEALKKEAKNKEENEDKRAS